MRNLILLTALLAVAGIASAGTQLEPEVTDPAGDQTINGDPLASCPAICPAHAYNHADILALWVSENGPTTAPTDIMIHVQTTESIDSTPTPTYAVFQNAGPANLSVSFQVHPGPFSYPESTANGTTYSVSTLGGAAATGLDNVTVTLTGNITTFTIPLTSIQAVGGDELHVFQANAQADCPCDATESYSESGFDGALNNTNIFTVSRPPVTNGVSVVFLGGNITEEGVTTPFTGTAINTKDGNATIRGSLLVVNSGSDSDTFSMNLQVESLNQQSGPSAPVTLAAGAQATMTFDVQLANEVPGSYDILASVSSGRGATGNVSLALEVFAPNVEIPDPETPPETPEENPEEDGNNTLKAKQIITLPFFSDFAEENGMTDIFGTWAEVVIILAILLILALIILLIFFLARRTWLDIELNPKKMAVRPGEHAEFLVTIRNRRGDARDLHVRFDPAVNWNTGLLLEDPSGNVIEPNMEPNTDQMVLLHGKKEGGTLEGMLRVRVPKTAGAKDRNRILVTAAPIDPDTRKEFKKKTKAVAARVTVDTSPVPVTPDEPEVTPDEVPLGVHLIKVRHEPEEPLAGDDMTTTAIIEHDGFDQVRIQAECFVNGKSVGKEVFALKPEEARAVVFPWTCPDGPADVKVEIDQI